MLGASSHTPLARARPLGTSPLRTAACWLYMAALFIVSFYGLIWYLIPCLLLIPLFSQTVYRRVMDWFQVRFFELHTFLAEKLIGMKFVISGDEVPSNDCGIMICNHRTRTDFIFLWSLFYYRLRVDVMKIALKYELKWATGFGWACQVLSFLFLRRNWEQDKGISSFSMSCPGYLLSWFSVFGVICPIERCFQYHSSYFCAWFLRRCSIYLLLALYFSLGHLSDLLGCWRDIGYPVQLLFFPEGTDLSPGNLKRSWLYSEK